MKTKIPYSTNFAPVTKSQLKKRIKVDANSKMQLRNTSDGITSYAVVRYREIEPRNN